MSSNTTPSAAVYPNLADLQTFVQTALAQGTIPLEGEIEARTALADLLIREYEKGGQRNVQHLRDSIRHVEVVLRRLPQDSPERPRHLNRLSYSYMSEYTASQSRRAIDEAVLCGRLAHEEAISIGLPEKDRALYCEILNNFGVALSYRSQDTSATPSGREETSGSGIRGAPDDLDEAIQCARQMKTHTAPESDRYLTMISNLASRLTRRHSMRGDPADYAEVVQLLRELQSLSQPGSMTSGLAIMQLAQLAVDKFHKSNALKDLDEALQLAVDATDKLPDHYEGKATGFHQITTLYSHRYKRTNDVADIRNAVLYSDKNIAATPSSHRARNRHILDHMQLLRDFANAASSNKDVEEAASQGHQRLADIGSGCPEQDSCRNLYCDILGRKYIISHKLEDFVDLVAHLEKLYYDYNDKLKESAAAPPVDSSLIYSLAQEARKLSSAPPGQTRDVASEMLYDQIVTTCKSGNFANGLLSVDKGFVKLLGVYAGAAHEGEVLREDEASQKVKELQLKEKESHSQPKWKPKDYETELGLRKLAIDPTNNRFVMDLSGLMSDILGYDPTKPMSYSEFVAKQAQLESESIEKAKAEGKHPNPKLCHMCRLVKPLSPTTGKNSSGGDVFEWDPAGWHLPFGNWNQLRLRTMCSICQLVLSLIVSDQTRRNLHPRLASIDREIQGTTLRAGEMGSGEVVLSVEYGMRPVGELRIVTPTNYTQALRQGWEAAYSQCGFEEFMNAVDNELPRSMAGQQVDISMLKRWLNDCDHNHGEACNIHYRGSSASMPLVFIDVLDYCLVSATSAVKYFALSYVWGTVDMSMTLLANYESRCKTRGLPTRLPNTISDAIMLVRDLGERYLWVDALCIVQDDDEHKARNIAHMDVVYNKAFATIVAMHGTSADSGLPGVRPETRPSQRIEKLVVDAGSKDLDFNTDRNSNEQVTLHLVATPPPLHFALEASKWDTRGWTFQERMLSRRCLYFSEHYVYFQCGRRDQVLSECGVNGPVRSKQDFWDKPGKVSVSTSLDNPLLDLRQELIDVSPEVRQAKSFTAYCKLVEKYSCRQLSYDSDIINAFLGTFAFLNESFRSDILCGLPASALDLALLWTPTKRNPRRGHTANMTMSQANLEGRPVLDHVLPTNRGTVLTVMGPAAVPTFDSNLDRRFPSWSWVGWKGPVEHRLFAEDEPLPTPLVRDFSVNLDGREVRTVAGRQWPRASPVSRSSNATAASPGDPVAAAVERLALNPDDRAPVPTPALPNVLQFCAPTVPLSAFTVSTQSEYISNADHIHAPGRQAVRHILDSRGARCGLWWEQAGYVYVGRGVSPEAEGKMVLAGISRCEDAFRARKGPDRVEGEIRLFDEEVYPAVGRGSGIVNVLAVDCDMGHEYGERVTVARIHVKAWEDARPVVRMVRLA